MKARGERYRSMRPGLVWVMVLGGVLAGCGGPGQTAGQSHGLIEDGSKDYHFVVLTETAGMLARPEQRFKPVVNKINAAMPDFVVVLGDVYDPVHNGGRDEAAVLEGAVEAYEALRVVRFFVPGSDEVATAERRRAWQKRVGPLWQSWTYKNNRFVALCADVSDRPERCFSDEQVAFLSEQVGRLGPDDRLYVFVDEPFWAESAGPGRADWLERIHPLLARAGRATVLAGRWDQWVEQRSEDGVRYLVVGGEGLEAGRFRSQPFLGPLMSYSGRSARGAGGRAAEVSLPRLEEVVIDGQVDDWADGGLVVQARRVVVGRAEGPVDCQARWHLGWNAQGVVAMVEVVDDVVLVERTAADAQVPFERRDAVRLVVGPVEAAGRWGCLFVAPSMLSGRAALSERVRQADGPWQAVVGRGRGDCRLARNGYTVEMLLPWSSLGMEKVSAGQELSLAAMVYDSDGAGQPMLLSWEQGGEGGRMVRSEGRRVRLVENRPAGPGLSVEGQAVRAGRLRLCVVGPAEFAGRAVVVLEDLAVVGRGVMLKAEQGSACTLIFCPPSGAPPPQGGAMEVYVGDEKVAVVDTSGRVEPVAGRAGGAGG